LVSTSNPSTPSTLSPFRSSQTEKGADPGHITDSGLVQTFETNIEGPLKNVTPREDPCSSRIERLGSSVRPFVNEG
jgi:hypothetical protein